MRSDNPLVRATLLQLRGMSPGAFCDSTLPWEDCRSAWAGLSGDDFVLIGGYESGMDAAFNLATSGSDVPAFPLVEDDLRLPAQPKDVSDLRKGDVVAFDEAHLPGHEAFPCVKLKQLGAAVAKVLQRNVKASFYQGLSALADRLILRRPIVRCIVVVQDRILVVDTRGRTALNYGGTGTVKSNRHVSTFSHASYPRTKDRDVLALHFRNPPKANWYQVAQSTGLLQAIQRRRASFEVMSDQPSPYAA